MINRVAKICEVYNMGMIGLAIRTCSKNWFYCGCGM